MRFVGANDRPNPDSPESTMHRARSAAWQTHDLARYRE